MHTGGVVPREAGKSHASFDAGRAAILAGAAATGATLVGCLAAGVFEGYTNPMASGAGIRGSAAATGVGGATLTAMVMKYGEVNKNPIVVTLGAGAAGGVGTGGLAAGVYGLGKAIGVTAYYTLELADKF